MAVGVGRRRGQVVVVVVGKVVVGVGKVVVEVALSCGMLRQYSSTSFSVVVLDAKNVIVVVLPMIVLR